MIATLQEDFILMAKAKGITNRRILWRHALRPSSLTLLTVAGLNVGALIGGTVVIEIIFGLPGMGTLLYQAIAERQFVMLQSLVVVIAVGYVLVNVFIDILYSILDPRLRHARVNRLAPITDTELALARSRPSPQADRPVRAGRVRSGSASARGSRSSGWRIVFLGAHLHPDALPLERDRTTRSPATRARASSRSRATRSASTATATTCS